MNIFRESFLRESLERSGADVLFVVLFGSYRRGAYDAFSDVDILAVCGDEKDKSLVSHELSKLSIQLNREIHSNLFTRHEFENRLELHDYLFASILEDSALLSGDKDYYDRARQMVLGNKPTAKSIEFNMRMGEKVLGYANDSVRSFRNSDSNSHVSNEPYYGQMEFLLKRIKNYHLALGYLLAGEEMRRLDETMSLKRLLRLQTDPVLENLISTEKKIRRAMSFSPQFATDLRKMPDLAPLSALLEPVLNAPLKPVSAQGFKEKILPCFSAEASHLTERST